ncbi:MAG TPA: polysaccharide biosynthesis/export family protein [Verrucomicrobiae bacterium]|jgi:protein involved in polysaccharide export with SLBB domain
MKIKRLVRKTCHLVRAGLMLSPRFLLLASFFAFAADSPSQGRSSTNKTAISAGRNMDSLDDKQKLGVGDAVSFRVLEDQEDSKTLTITDAGELDVPELGLVEAKGKTCKQLAMEIKTSLERVTYFHATVIIGLQLLNKTNSGRRVFVAGQVRQAGPQDIPAGETWTVSKAILAAGGFTDIADKKNVRLVRSGGKGESPRTIFVNMVDVWEKGHTELDIPVEAEDLIYVHARSLNFN